MKTQAFYVCLDFYWTTDGDVDGILDKVKELLEASAPPKSVVSVRHVAWKKGPAK